MPHLPMYSSMSSILEFMKCGIISDRKLSSFSNYDQEHQLSTVIVNNKESLRHAAQCIDMDISACARVPNNGLKMSRSSPPSVSAIARHDSPDKHRNRYLHFSNDLFPRTPKRPTALRIPKNHKRVVSLYDDITKKYSHQSPNVNPLMVASKVRSARKRKYPEIQERSDNLKSLVDMLNNSEQTLFKTKEHRFSEDFEVQDTLGRGSFGSVYLVKHRLDGVEYAVKQCKQVQFTGTRNTSCLREVWALSCISHHDNIVRYYCSWAEQDYLYIQLEYCNGGSLSRHINLADHVHSPALSPSCLCEDEMRHVLHDISSALHYLHHIGIVHMDVKPDNILISLDDDRLQELLDSNGSSNSSQCMFYSRLSCTTYKLADFGLATCHEKISQKCPAVEDGDKYYLPQEILSEDYSDLSKADVFALALTVYEAGSPVNIVRDADRWEEIHILGRLPPLEKSGDGFNKLLVSMISPDHRDRPTCREVLEHDVLANIKADTHRLAQLLQIKENENEELRRKLLDMELQLIKYKVEVGERSCHSPIRKCKSLDTAAAATVGTKLINLTTLQPQSTSTICDFDTSSGALSQLSATGNNKRQSLIT